MGLYLRGMDVYIMYRMIPDMVGYSHSQYVTPMFYVSLGGLWFHYVDQLGRIARKEHKTHV